MDIKTVALYVRVSTQEQAKEGYSVDEQLDRLRNYCKAKDYKLCKEYVDPGFSGATINRPSITQLIKDVEEKKINTVLVYKLDRLSRSQKDTLYLIEDVFLKNGANFVSMTENFDTGTPFGKAMIGILSVFAQLEREQIKERMSMGKEGRAKEGKWHGGVKVPIGYRFVDDFLVVDPYEAHIVKTCFQEYAGGKSVDYIYSELKFAGMKSSYGELTKPTIYFMLHNNVYIGVIKHRDKEYPGLHEAIIDQKTFDIVQARFERNRNNPKYANSFEPITILGGLLKCKCGCNMRIRFGWKHKDGYQQKYYICKNRLDKAGSCTVNSRSYRTQDVQKVVLEEVGRLKLDPLYFINQIRESRNKVAPVKEDPEIEIIKARISEIEKQIEKAIRLYTVSNLDFDIVTRQIEELTEEKNQLSQTIEERTTPPEKERPRITTNETIEVLESLTLDDLNANTLIEGAEESRIREILTILIDKIILDGDTIDIHWNFYLIRRSDRAYRVILFQMDNAIHTYAGVQLRLACAELMEKQGHGEPTGQAKLTPAYNLPCDYVLHTVGPIIYVAVTQKDRDLLAACYRSCLELAQRNGIGSVAFCCISTGEFHFPNDEAASIAVDTVRRYRGNTEVIFNVFKDVDDRIYRELLG